MMRLQSVLAVLAVLAGHAAFGYIISIDTGVATNYASEVVKRGSRIEFCDDKESVDLAGLDITAVPQRFVKSEHLRSIKLQENLISSLPAGTLQEVPNLVSLNLARNRLQLADVLSVGHQRLKMLTLSYQRSEVVQRPFGAFPQRFWHPQAGLNQPELVTDPQYPDLVYLDLSGNVFPRMPDNWGRMFPQLTQIYLTDIATQDVAEDFFWTMPRSLKSLHLENNLMRQADFRQLGPIEELFLDGNPLAEGIKILDGPNLRLLSACNCSLRALTWNVSLPLLTDLALSNNLLNELPAESFLSLTRLERLDLARNRLQVVPDLQHLVNLQTLSLEGNYIVEMSSQAINLPGLTRLILSGNYLERIHQEAFARLSVLEELDLSGNMLVQMPAGWTAQMARLRYLNLSKNEFRNINDMSIGHSANITDLYVRGKNVVTIYPAELQQLPTECNVHV